MMRFVLSPTLLVFTILPLAAQDRIHIALDLAYQGSSVQTQDFVSVSALHRTQPGIEIGWLALSLGQVDFRLVSGLRANASSDVEVEAGFRSAKIGTLSHQSIALGAEATWRRTTELGGGIQVRREQMTLTMMNAMFPDTSITIFRPWLTSHVGWSWKNQNLTPFFHFLLSVPLTEKKYSSDRDIVQPSEQLVKSLAPSIELGVAFGLRF